MTLLGTVLVNLCLSIQTNSIVFLNSLKAPKCSAKLCTSSYFFLSYNLSVSSSASCWPLKIWCLLAYRCAVWVLCTLFGSSPTKTSRIWGNVIFLKHMHTRASMCSRVTFKLPPSWPFKFFQVSTTRPHRASPRRWRSTSSIPTWASC